MESQGMIHAIVTWLGGVVGGGESSPLAPTSSYSEIIRLIQMGIFAGVLYLIKELKGTRRSSDETHTTILKDVRTIQDGLKVINDRLDVLEGNGKQ